MDAPYFRLADDRTRLVTVGHSLLVIVAAFVVGGIVLIPIVDAVLGAVGITSETAPAAYRSALLATQFVGFGVVVVGYLAMRDEWDLFGIRLPSLRELGLAVGGFVGVFVLWVVAGYLASLFGLQSAQNRVVQLGRQNRTLFLYLAVLSFLFVAPGEELVFRGVVQGLLRRGYGVVPGVVGASVLFGFAHMLALTGSGKLLYVALAALMGAVLGALYEYTENLVVPMLVHGLWNAFLFLGQWALTGAGG